MDVNSSNAPPQGDYPGSENKRLGEVAHELGRLLRSSAPVDWQRSRRWCSDILRPLIEASPTSRRLRAMFEGREFIVGGDEHHVVNVESEPDRSKLSCGKIVEIRMTPIDKIVRHDRAAKSARKSIR